MRPIPRVFFFGSRGVFFRFNISFTKVLLRLGARSTREKEILGPGLELIQEHFRGVFFGSRGVFFGSTREKEILGPGLGLIEAHFEGLFFGSIVFSVQPEKKGLIFPP